MENNSIIGIDLGGTNVRGGLVSDSKLSKSCVALLFILKSQRNFPKVMRFGLLKNQNKIKWKTIQLSELTSAELMFAED